MRHNRNSEASDEKAVLATLEILAEYGPAFVTAAEVAKRAGISRSSVYSRVSRGGVERLIQTAVEWQVQRVITQIRAIEGRGVLRVICAVLIPEERYTVPGVAIRHAGCDLQRAVAHAIAEALPRAGATAHTLGWILLALLADALDAGLDKEQARGAIYGGAALFVRCAPSQK